jgi:hypothetical protein
MRYSILLGALLFTPLSFSHPVSYKGATGIMSYNTATSNDLLLTYSLTHKFAVAATYIREEESEFQIPRLNYLVKRWNNDDSQGNFYLSGGAGVEKYKNKNYDAKLAEVVADWEDRQYYIYFEHLHLVRENQLNTFLPETSHNHSKFRLGTAPFLADFEDLNIWYILQWDKHNEPKIELTQFVRIFRKNALIEIGAGFNNNWAFNYMFHF